MYINSVSANLKVGTSDGIKPFGFKHVFSDGLNILTGDNSSGKSTILSCIYYCLGMEQLMGSKGINALSPALHQALNYDGHVCNVIESSCTLTIAVKDERKFTLSRAITSSDESSINEILISDGKSLISKFVHSARDHGDQGFYQWLAEVNGLDIFDVDSFKGDVTRPLYMQYIFSLAFVEQTKGWSDIFSMLPSFGIKDPRQKIVEYSLGLKSLDLNMKLDQIKVEKQNLVNRWKSIDRDLKYRAQANQLYISKYDGAKPIEERKIQGIFAAELDERESELKTDRLIENLREKIDKSLKRINDVNNSSDISKNLINTREKIKETLYKSVRERQEVSDLLDEEKQKLENFYRALSSANKDIQGFQDVKKLSVSRNWESLGSSKCPVCDHSVENKKDSDLSEETIEKSIAFLKSQKSTYEKYIEASESVIERYKSALVYFNKNIALKRMQLDDADRDLNSPASQSIRSELELQSELKYRLNEVLRFDEFLESIRNDMLLISEDFFDLDEEEKRLKGLISSDDQVINRFKKGFIQTLDTFGYKSNGVKNITIQDKAPHRLLPIVYIEGQEPQYIRYVSSASDFVRSIWSYYLCLLKAGDKHPGFLIMDEPGQHQMRVDSMKALLKFSADLGKQVIFAISQDRDYDKKDVNIFSLIEDIEPDNINVLHIDDNTYCISPIVEQE